METTNKFELHVGKGSRARKNEELQEFFEARDDDAGEVETFDSIDDNDLDLSDYESEDDSEEATSFPPVPINIRCKLQQCAHDKVFTSATGLVQHLKTVHWMSFKNLNHMALMLQRYLDAWSAELEQNQLSEVVSRQSQTADGTTIYQVSPGSCPADREIRGRVQRENLEEILRCQEQERQGEAQESRKCLFCKRTYDNRALLFRHAYRIHSFNIGQHDNLVFVNEFLDILKDKLSELKCLYCEKTFTSPAVLRKHMRKKKHFKISSNNRMYDRFYIINYTEPGRNWMELEEESDSSEDDSWTGWDEKAEMKAQSLFDGHVSGSAKACWEYMRKTYGFDIHETRETHGLDFYQTVGLINLIRQSTRNLICFGCQEKFPDNDSLVGHLKNKGADHLKPPTGEKWWEEKLKPVVENDALLMEFEDGGEDKLCEKMSKNKI